MTPILLTMQYWKYITIALLSVLLLLSIFYINNIRGDIDLLSVEHDLEITQMKAKYVDTAREIEREAYAQQIEAINEYKKREEVILADAASSRDAVRACQSHLNQLQQQLSQMPVLETSTSIPQGGLLKNVQSDIDRWEKLLNDLIPNSNSSEIQEVDE